MACILKKRFSDVQTMRPMVLLLVAGEDHACRRHLTGRLVPYQCEKADRPAPGISENPKNRRVFRAFADGDALDA
jgi:hypothetical protein